MKSNENAIQKKLLAYLKTRSDIYYFRSGVGAFKAPSGGYFRTGRKGCPDISIIKDGNYIGVEVKDEKGKLSEDQERAREDILNCGGDYCIVRSLEELKAILE